MGWSWLGRSVQRQLLPRVQAAVCVLPAVTDRSQLLPPPTAILPLVGSRHYSSGGGGQRKQLVVLGIPNPLLWLRSRVYYFLIRSYFDHDFSIQEFSRGARQASVT
ncbi:hypothetical protein NDU88_004114 [Pleurodeles waltl]|uniref:Uncharacterized protein n=1 Tax=Pleurodeles waltl TaxID=8319 RepID=A0AAV7UEH3_PLEWA|nr:hypothetical protein NDU88_004114 [Pleurodeles waltl]